MEKTSLTHTVPLPLPLREETERAVLSKGHQAGNRMSRTWDVCGNNNVKDICKKDKPSISYRHRKEFREKTHSNTLNTLNQHEGSKRLRTKLKYLPSDVHSRLKGIRNAVEKDKKEIQAIYFNKKNAKIPKNKQKDYKMSTCTDSLPSISKEAA